MERDYEIINYAIKMRQITKIGSHSSEQQNIQKYILCH